MKQCHLWACLAGLLLGAGGLTSLVATDFPEPLRVIDPLLTSQPDAAPVFMAGGSSELGFNFHLLSSTPDDSWNLHSTAAFTLFCSGDTFAMAAYYGAWTLTAPIAPGAPSGNALRLWLSALEFEYGITAAVGIGPLQVIAEYARTSQHPLVSRFSQVSTDSVKLGLVLPRLQTGDFTQSWYLRGGVVDLFDFWRSILPKPRLMGMVTLGNELEWRFTPDLGLFATGSADWNIKRHGGTDLSGRCELGGRFGTGPARAELYLAISGTPDSEEIQGGVNPSTLAGIGFRFSLEWP
jgi:hypothetical protein